MVDVVWSLEGENTDCSIPSGYSVLHHLIKTCQVYNYFKIRSLLTTFFQLRMPSAANIKKSKYLCLKQYNHLLTAHNKKLEGRRIWGLFSSLIMPECWIHVSELFLAFASLSQDGCHSSRHHTLTQYCPKSEERGRYTRRQLCLISSLKGEKHFPEGP